MTKIMIKPLVMISIFFAMIVYLNDWFTLEFIRHHFSATPYLFTGITGLLILFIVAILVGGSICSHSYQKIIKLECSKDEAYSKISEALIELGERNFSVNKHTKQIIIHKGISALTFGEIITINFVQQPYDAVKIKMTSKLNFGIFDWGKNKRNLKAIESRILPI